MYLLTMQSQTTYETKTKTVETREQADSYCAQAQKAAGSTIYDDKFDGLDGGLIRAMRLKAAKSGNEYVLTVHRLAR